MNLPVSYGRGLDETTIKVGLRELCPGIQFDNPTNHGQWHPYQDTRQGVFYDGRHISSMDRGIIPENKVWDSEEGVVEISMSEIDRYDDSMIIYVEILPTDSFYDEARARAEKNDDNFSIDERGKVFKYTAMRPGTVHNRIIRVGWQHTFERLIEARIPGITREALMLKFGIYIPPVPVQIGA